MSAGLTLVTYHVTVIELFHGCFAGVLPSFEDNAFLLKFVLRFPSLMFSTFWKSEIRLLLRFGATRWGIRLWGVSDEIMIIFISLDFFVFVLLFSSYFTNIVPLRSII